MVKHILIVVGGVVLYAILVLLQLLVLNLLGMAGDLFILLSLVVAFGVTVLAALLVDSWK